VKGGASGFYVGVHTPGKKRKAKTMAISGKKIRKDVFCEIEFEDNSVRATCSRCGHETESFGQHEGSIRRCLVLMNEECPEDEDNYYVCDEA